MLQNYDIIKYKNKQISNSPSENRKVVPTGKGELHMAKTVKKVDVKKVAKMDLSKAIAEFLTDSGFTVNTDSAEFGFSEGTIVVSTDATDVQVKFITPKAGVTKYEVVADEEAAE